MREIHIKDKVRFSSLFIIVLLLVFAIAGLSHFDNRALEVHAQKSSSCVGSLVDCSPSGSSSANDNDEKDNNDGDSDDNWGDQKEDKKAGDIEAKIPSIAGGGVPFP